MTNETIGEAFSRSYDQMSNGLYKKAQTKAIPQRLQIQQGAQNIRLAMLQGRLAAMKQAHEDRLRQMDISNQHWQEDFGLNQQRLDLEQQKFNASQSPDMQGSAATYRENKTKMGGIPFTRQTSSGGEGTFVMPTGVQRTAFQKVIDAYPQMAPLMTQLQGGAKYMGGSGPEKLQKVGEAAISYMAGNATPAQSKLLSDAGISEDALIQASETAQRVMNIPKTNEGMKQAFDLFMPRKGDTGDTYSSRMNNINNNFKERYYQAQYQLQGIPVDSVDDASNGESSKDMNNYVKAHMSLNSEPINQSISGDEATDGVDEKDISQAMAANPSASREEIIAAIKRARGD